MATIYDSVTVSALPFHSDAIYLGYVDGAWPNYAAVKARFPNNRVLSVTTTGFTKADICDVETGDASPQIARLGVQNGLYDTVYSARSNLAPLDAALRGLAWHWFCADWTGVPHLVPGSVATQYADPPASGGNYDISITDGTWPNTPVPVIQSFSDPDLELLMSLAASPTDAFNVYVRDKWATYRSDPLTPAATQYLAAGYAGPWHGSLDAVLACIIDTATIQGHLRPQYAGAA